MIVPIDLLTPILEDLLTYGRPNHPPRPWIGCYSGESEGHVMIAGLLPKGPASQAGMRVGDIVWSVRNEAVGSLADFYRKLWRRARPVRKFPSSLCATAAPSGCASNRATAARC